MGSGTFNKTWHQAPLTNYDTRRAPLAKHDIRRLSQNMTPGARLSQNMTSQNKTSVAYLFLNNLTYNIVTTLCNASNVLSAAPNSGWRV